MNTENMTKENAYAVAKRLAESTLMECIMSAIDPDNSGKIEFDSFEFYDYGISYGGYRFKSDIIYILYNTHKLCITMNFICDYDINWARFYATSVTLDGVVINTAHFKFEKHNFNSSENLYKIKKLITPELFATTVNKMLGLRSQSIKLKEFTADTLYRAYSHYETSGQKPVGIKYKDGNISFTMDGLTMYAAFFESEEDVLSIIPVDIKPSTNSPGNYEYNTKNGDVNLLHIAKARNTKQPLAKLHYHGVTFYVDAYALEELISRDPKIIEEYAVATIDN